MTIDISALEAKIRQFYPEISKHGLAMQINEDKEKKAWVVTLSKGGHVLSTFLETADASGCLEGRECVHLSHQIGQFIMNYCADTCET
ncbi:MAG: hypothetical protein ACOZEN_00005 [Thermodesulfobacteriota bacterium]